MKIKTFAFFLIVVSTLLFSTSAAVQAAKDRPIEGCSLLDISCQAKKVTERTSSAVSAASDWASDTASRASNRASEWARDTADSARSAASSASQRARDWAGDAANVAASSARRAADSAESYVRDAYDQASRASRTAVDKVYSSGSERLRETLNNGNEFMQGVYAGGPEFLRSLDLDREVAIAMLFLPGVHPAASWQVARVVTYEVLRYHGYEVGSDPVLDAAINLAIDYTLSTPPHLVWQLSPEITQELIDEFGRAIALNDVVQLAIDRMIQTVEKGEIQRTYASCSLQPVLRVGELALLGSDIPSRIRNAPSVDGEFLDNIIPFERVYIAGGPVCNNGYFWYYVIAESADGWTVQGADGRYWLDPLPEQSAFGDTSRSRSTATRSRDTSDCPIPPRLRTDARATISPGPPNSVRNGPSLYADRVGRIHAGETLDVLSGPICADGYNWYEVRTQYFYGWTAEAGDGEYWVVNIR